MVAAPDVLRAQHTYEELAARHSLARAYYEAFALPAEGGTALVVAFRIPNSMLVFVRNRSGASEGGFTAEVELTVQVVREGQVVEEQLWRRQHEASTFEETQDRMLDLEGALFFVLEPGLYGYRLTFQDGHARRPRQSPLHAVTLPDFGALSAGRAFMAQHVRAGAPGVDVHLTNLGGDVSFGHTAQVLIPVGLPAAEAPGEARLQYTLRRLGSETVREEARRQAALARREEGGAVPLAVEEPLPYEGAQVVLEGQVEGALFTPVPAFEAEGLALGRLQWPAAPARPAGYLVPLDLGGVQLEDGTYVLDVVLQAGDTTAAVQQRFQTHWRGMPISLHHPAVAIRNLSFIEDRKTVRAMLKGSYAAQEARIRQYWKQRDPTPETAFNELMAEYYRRVDHAASTFRTGTTAVPDGLKTDRARIYIVHGPPDAVERRLSDLGGVEEVWMYPDGRRFVFWAANSLDAFELQAGGS